MQTFFRRNTGLIAVLVLGFVPALRWFFIAPVAPRFATLGIAARSFGQMTGLTGMALFALVLILSSRLKVLDRFFTGGLADVYDVHQKIGQISFCLLLMHPLFLVVNYLNISLRAAALFLLPQNFDAKTFGTIALTMMIVLLFITLYTKWKYHNWKISHKFMVLAFMFAVIHTLLIVSDISSDSFLRFYILGLSAIGLALGFYQAFLSKYLNKDFKYKIKLVENLNEQVVKISFEPNTPAGREKLNFLPGQFGFVKFFSRAVSAESHPFSISSSPEKENLEMVIKSSGDFTSDLKKIKQGDLAEINGPFGKFSYESIKNKNQIWLAGGVGITPFLSMAENAAKENYKIDLYYCTKNKEEAVLIDELLEISSKNKNFRVFAWFSDEKGFIGAKDIFELSNGVLEKAVLLCGPAGFMKGLTKQFLKLGVKKNNIYFEDFSFI